jgi:hypothetical protein
MPVIGDIMRYTFSPLLFRAQWAPMVKIMFAPREVPDYFWRFPPWMAFRPSQHRAAKAEIAQIAPAAAMLGAIVGQVVLRLDHQDREHHDCLERRAPALGAVAVAQRCHQLGPEHLEVHHRRERLELVPDVPMSLSRSSTSNNPACLAIRASLTAHPRESRSPPPREVNRGVQLLRPRTRTVCGDTFWINSKDVRIRVWGWTVRSATRRRGRRHCPA